MDESNLEKKQFNWGYDPVNYNIPEGSYSSDPYHGEVRVKELKQTIATLHRNGISIVMDVVYNHVYDAGQFSINKLVPGYFSRIHNGKYSNGSYCGNDTASERSMVRKFIVDSVNYWADEYHIDGFRFDIVGLLDIDTVNEVVRTVHQKRPDIIFYGEGWSMNTNLTKSCELATQQHSEKTPRFAYFNDSIRDSLRGSPFNGHSGFLIGDPAYTETLQNCFLGLPDWCKTPEQTINYISCHDDHTIFDRIRLLAPQRTEQQHIQMNKLAAVLISTSQGIPFMQAGEEMLRSKRKTNGSYEHNSYKSPDRINSLKWKNLDNPKYAEVLEYYKGLIAFRKAHPALRMTSASAIRRNIKPIHSQDPFITSFLICCKESSDSSKAIFLAFNASDTARTLPLPSGQWELQINENHAGTECLRVCSDTVTLNPISSAVLVQNHNHH